MKIHNLEGGYTAESYNSIETHRDGYILGGWNASPDTINGGSFLETRTFTVLDANLEVLKSGVVKEIGAVNSLQEILRFNRPEDTYVFVGRSNQNTPDGRRRLSLDALDANLDTVWNYQHEDPRTYTSDAPLGAFVDSSSASIWVHGYYFPVFPLYRQALDFDSLGLHYSWFRQISFDGELLREFNYSYDSIRHSETTRVVKVGDSLLCASIYVSGSAPQNDSCAIACFYLDDLSEKFSVMLPGMERQGEPFLANDIILNESGDQILVPTYGDTIHTGSWGGPYRWRPEYYSVDFEGNITPLWKQTVENYYLLWSLNSTRNGDIISTGQRNIGLENHLYATLTRRSGVDLSVLWERNFTFSDTSSHHSWDWFLDEAMELPNGEILAIGSVSINENEGQDDIRGLVLKLDSLGCPYANCGQDTIIYLDADVRTSSTTSNELQTQARFFSMLNSISQSTDMQVQLFDGIGTDNAAFVLTDITGREVYSWPASQRNFTLRESGVDPSSGIYQLSFVRGGQILQMERLTIRN